ncbi:MAG: hypothetical protein WKF43_13050 [Acidimicrobiales bacterium]
MSEPGPVDSFEFRPDDSFSLVPFLDWDSDFTFTYRVTDGAAFSAPVTVTVDMIAINNPPIGEDDSYELAAGETLEVIAPGVLANDSTRWSSTPCGSGTSSAHPGAASSTSGRMARSRMSPTPGPTGSPAGRATPHRAG